MLLITTVIIVLLVLLIWWWRTLDKIPIPGPMPLPIFGNALGLGRTPQEIFRTFLKLSKQYGEIWRIYVGSKIRIITSNPRQIEMILNSNVHLKKSDAYDLMRAVFHEGLVTSSGQKWKIRRKLITPSFHFQILDQFMETFNTGIDILVAKLNQYVGSPLNVQPLIKLCTLDIICETAMGVKIDAQHNGGIEYINAMKLFFEIIDERFLSVTRYDSIFKLTPQYRKFKKALEVIQGLTKSVINAKRAIKSNKQISVNFSEEGIRRKVALLDMLLEHKELNDSDIMEEINTFIFAGHDTTTAMICYILLELSRNPDVQEKLYAEIISVFHPEDTIKLNDLQKLRYLDMVIKEVQRVNTIIPIIERVVEEDLQLDDCVLKKDMTVTMFLHAMHHCEKYFPNPEKFDPDRFLPDEQSKRDPFTFLPFSAGPRNCIGQRFALLEVKVATVKILMNFKILPVPEFQPDLGIIAVLHSFNGIQVQLEKRK